MTAIVWFRKDLRLADNPALSAASAKGPVLPVYILEDDTMRPAGGASKWWLRHSLEALSGSLGGLVLRRGAPEPILKDMARRTGAAAVYWNRRYEPDAIRRDREIKEHLRAAGLEVHSFNGALLNEPWEVATGSGAPFKVFTPFWKAARQRAVADPLPAPALSLAAAPDGSDDLREWALAPAAPDWAAGWTDHWSPGEAGARTRLSAFLKNRLGAYGAERDRSDLPATSRLSPHLHFGEISPRQIHSAVHFQADRDPSQANGAAKFMSEVGWREFSHHLLYHFPQMTTENWRPAFGAYPWREAPDDLARWQRGLTGYPFVDAGLRELWRTGFMHNRVRMIAASFLVKHLRIHWRRGEAWFWDTLVDADAANNAAGWQWVAGSGADAAPYFRIFNPVIQGRKFDPDGAYVRRWCPELAGLNTKWVHAPFEAPPMDLAAAGVRLGDTYPRPMVEHAAARAAALEGYEAVKNA